MRLLSAGSGVRIPSGSFGMVGVAQLVSASDCGSEGRGFESLYPPFALWQENLGLSPSGKAQGFDPCIRWFESS